MNKQHLMEHFLKQDKINPSVTSSLLKDFNSNKDNYNDKYIFWKGDTEGRAFIAGKVIDSSAGINIFMQWYKVKEEPFVDMEEIKNNLLIVTVNDAPLNFEICNPDKNPDYQIVTDDKDNSIIISAGRLPVLANIKTTGLLTFGENSFEAKERGVYFVKINGVSETAKLSFLGK